MIKTFSLVLLSYLIHDDHPLPPGAFIIVKHLLVEHHASALLVVYTILDLMSSADMSKKEMARLCEVALVADVASMQVSRNLFVAFNLTSKMDQSFLLD